MHRFKKSLAVIVLCGGSIAAWSVGSSLVSNVQFARAAQEIEATRQELAKVEDLASVYKAVNKVVEQSVVSINVHKTVKNPARDMIPEELRGRFFPDRDGDGEPDMPDQDQYGTGSGVIMEVNGDTGYILTNNHVAGGATELTITLSDGREIKNGKLLGADPKSDLAVIKIESEHLQPAKWGNSDYLEKGDIVMAFGSPLGYVGSMTHGIVSALNRNARIISGQFAYENFIQVDAPINPGNSGGPLVNTRGEVVGINTAIASRTGGFQGIGFAIPSNQAKYVYQNIKEKGKVVRGWLGIEIADVSKVKDLAKNYDGTTGVFVKGVTRNAPAQDKLEPGDVITAINGKPVVDRDQLRNMIAQTPPDTEVKLTISRNGNTETVALKIGEQPEDLRSFLSGRTGSGEADADEPKSIESLGMRLSEPTDQLIERFNLDGVKNGAIVTAVNNGSPAMLSGMQPGDLITKINDKPVRSPDDVKDILGKADLEKGVRIYVKNAEGTRVLSLQSNEK